MNWLLFILGAAGIAGEAILYLAQDYNLMIASLPLLFVLGLWLVIDLMLIVIDQQQIKQKKRA